MTAAKAAKTDISFVILRLANKITLPHQLAALHVLRVLARCANNSACCYPSYALICAMSGGIAESTLCAALEYLYELQLLTQVKKGHGNQHGEYNASSVYRFNIAAMRHLVKHQGIYSPDDNDNKALLHGTDLTARVKLLTSLTLPSMPPADLPEHSADLSGDSADLSEGSADLRDTRLTSSLKQLPDKATPSVKQLTEERENPPTQDTPAVRRGAPSIGGTPQCLPPLTSVRLASRMPLTKANRHLPSGFRPEREVQYLSDEPC